MPFFTLRHFTYIVFLTIRKKMGKNKEDAGRKYRKPIPQNPKFYEPALPAKETRNILSEAGSIILGFCLKCFCNLFYGNVIHQIL